MATYKEIFGKQIKFLSSDPTNEGEGQIWYNSTSGTFKSVLVSEAWSAASPTINTQKQSFATGTQTAGLLFAGATTPPTVNIAKTEEYNGVGWTAGGAQSTARRSSGGAGTQTASLMIAGYETTAASALVEEYDGSSWTTSPVVNNAKYICGAFGTATAALVEGGAAAPHPFETWNNVSWTSGPGPIGPANKYGAAGSGTTTAGLFSGGFPNSPTDNMNASLEYNGTAFSAGGNLNTGRGYMGGFGIQTATVVTGGTLGPGTYQTITETYDGGTWSTSPATLATASAYGGATGTSTAGISGGFGHPANSFDSEEFNRTATVITAAAWAAGGNYPFNAGDFSGAGTTTASIAFGGKIYPGPNAVTNVSASYDGASWTVGPSITTARGLAASAKNGTTTAALCTGGYEPALSDKCEEFNGSSWTEGPNYPVSAQFGDQGVGTQTAALISGGYGGAPGSAYLDATSTYNGSSWTALSAPSNLQDSRFSATATGTSTAGLMLAGIGGAGKVESWNGSAWSEQAEALTARTQGGSSGPSTDALYFGGEGPTGVTEGFDGTAWSTRPTMGTARFSLASCGTQTLALAIGGFTSSNSTEEYTGETTAGNYKTITTS